MKIHQLSLFLENKPNQLSEPCRLLAEAGIDIRTLIVSDWERGAKVLQEAGYVVNVTQVVAVEVPDRPGGLVELLEVFRKTDINIEYMYAFTFGRGETAVLIFRFDNPDVAIERLQAAGVSLVGSSGLYKRVEK